MTAPELKPRITHVVLFQGDDFARIQDIRRDAAEALQTTPVRRVGDGLSDVDLKAAEHDAIVEEASERAITVTLQAMGRTQWRDLVLAHPARDGEKGDEELGFNVDELGDVLVAESLTKPLSDPKFDSVAQADAWLDELSHADFQRLYSAAYVLNTDAHVPKAGLASRLARIGDETSRSPVRLGEASDSSTTSDQSETSG